MKQEKIKVFLENLTDDDAEILMEGMLLVRDEAYRTMMYLKSRDTKANKSLYQLLNLQEEKYRKSNIVISIIRKLWNNN